MATYELQGGEIYASPSLGGGQIFASPSLGGGEIYAGGGGGGGNLQPSKSVSYTPTESAQSETVTPDFGYDGMEEVSVSVGAIPSDYVGSDIPLCDSSDVEATITDTNFIRSHSVDVADGYYEDPVSLLNPFGTATFSPVGTPYVDPSTGDLTVQFKADTAGMAYTKSSYSITDEGAFNVKGAQTYTPGTTDQTIASGQYLTGAQTILGDADLVAGNIKKDVQIFGVTGTYEGGGGGVDLSAIANAVSYNNISGMFQAMMDGNWSSLEVTVLSGTNPIVVNFGRAIKGFIAYPKNLSVLGGLANNEKYAFMLSLWNDPDENGEQTRDWGVFRNKGAANTGILNRITNFTLINGVLSIIPQYPSNNSYNPFTFGNANIFVYWW